MRRTLIAAVLLIPVTLASAIDPEHQKKAEEVLARSITWLRAQQGAGGGWAVPVEGPAYPAITALVLNGMLMQPGIDETDPAVARGIAFLLKNRQPDGGIYDRVLPSYNTSIALSALARVNTPEARAAIRPAQDFLRTLQFGEGAMADGQFASETGRVTKENPFYGGVGYGRSGRPDLSNLSMFLQGMHDSGVPGDDPAFQRALVFLGRVQMLDSANDMPYADGSKQGGFIYSTGPNKEKAGTGQTYAGTIEETMDDGTKVSRLRSYGSMTYAGFKSYLYANLPRTDQRVAAAYDWIRANYTLVENPGTGTDGLYYYLVTFARALDALGEPTITVLPAPGDTNRTVVPHDWANDLIDRLAELQNPDGSFRSVDDRWMENNPVLITAYAVLALEHVAR
ncbi:MAG: hypothetical protein IT437_12775 [Phycisphaerales bacterium]|nr:hypothetical protein [Phycisphaerales bacterium]